ncbi:SDR family NAD(P)-dependent oxidoreductase [Oceanobacillus sp. 143]|uniref:Short-chain dehydrogenase n=1 Tax=Oceanobacillus zhaokaii TaxID=2052660 RepID=A0A345PDY9_9BACI|nr:short-chain dehydrogenase [Oceanobacillus zhaokaii]AXI08219.1 short-chain dehydrogenase [Oceanobacillus zhaokaii]QGS68146.1 SDR family NAD(P)-dependent oxidoreductase [Oceanobacillus sp. 143]
MKHALVVGGTGMLSNVSLWLLAKEYHVSIVARNSGRMKKLIEKSGMKSNVTPIMVDYKNYDELQKKVHSTIEQNGDIDIVVAWIHSDAPDALEIIAKEVSINKNQWELFHVLGSSSDLSKIKREVRMTERCLYYQVQLGFVIEGANSRWLTNKEISDGIIEAIKKKKKILTIGQIEPWDKHP